MIPMHKVLIVMGESKNLDSFQMFILRSTESVRSGMEILNKFARETHTLFVISDDGRLLGTVTDGDIRRALLNNISL